MAGTPFIHQILRGFVAVDASGVVIYPCLGGFYFAGLYFGEVGAFGVHPANHLVYVLVGATLPTAPRVAVVDELFVQDVVVENPLDISLDMAQK